MKELVFLLEEASAKAMLETLLPRLLHPDIRPRFIPFEGNQDLERQMFKRLRGYVNPQARCIILRDQDNAPDCVVLKARLAERCQQAGQGVGGIDQGCLPEGEWVARNRKASRYSQ